MIKEYDVVKATKMLSDSIAMGCRGAVVMVHSKPALGYEVEFVDDNGETLDVLTVYQNDIELLS